MSDFEHIKNDMPKFGHIKNYIIRYMKKHRNRVLTRETVLFNPVWFLNYRIEGNLLFNMSIGDHGSSVLSFGRIWQSALTTGR